MSSTTFTPPPLSLTSGVPQPVPRSNLSAPFRRNNARRRSPIHPAWSLPTSLPWRRSIKFSRVRVLENQSLPHDVIRSALNPLMNLYVLRSDVEEVVSSLCKWYREHGFLFAAISVATWPTPQSPLLELRCTEALLHKVNLIPISKDGVTLTDGKLLRTKVDIVARAMGFQTGKPFCWKGNGSFEKLMNLGIFAQAKVEASLQSPERVSLNIYLCERPTARIEPGIGMNHNGDIYGDISILDTNVLGRAQTLRVEWQRRLDMARSAGGLEFNDPRIGAKIPVSLNFRAYRKSDSGRLLPNEDRRRGEANRNEVRLGPFRSTVSPELDSDRDGAVILATYNLPHMNASVTSGPIVERVYWKESQSDGVRQVNKDQFAWKSIIKHVTSKPSLSPREGHQFSVEHTFGVCQDGSEKAFQKLVFGLSQHLTVSSLMQFSFSSAIGLGSENLPPHEMMVLGGRSTVRGYTYGELGRAPSWRTTRLEVRFPLNNSQESVVSSRSKARQPNENRKTDENEIGTKARSTPQVPTRESSETSIIERLPTLSPYLFADSATRGAFSSFVSGSSYGVGLRIAGIVNVEFARGAHGREPKLSISLVNHKNHT